MHTLSVYLVSHSLADLYTMFVRLLICFFVCLIACVLGDILAYWHTSFACLVVCAFVCLLPCLRPWRLLNEWLALFACFLVSVFVCLLACLLSFLLSYLVTYLLSVLFYFLACLFAVCLFVCLFVCLLRCFCMYVCVNACTLPLLWGDDDLRSNLKTYFFILIAVELAFLILPIVLSYVEILKEWWHVGNPIWLSEEVQAHLPWQTQFQTFAGFPCVYPRSIGRCNQQTLKKVLAVPTPSCSGKPKSFLTSSILGAETRSMPLGERKTHCWCCVNQVCKGSYVTIPM